MEKCPEMNKPREESCDKAKTEESRGPKGVLEDWREEDGIRPEKCLEETSTLYPVRACNQVQA